MLTKDHKTFQVQKNITNCIASERNYDGLEESLHCIIFYFSQGFVLILVRILLNDLNHLFFFPLAFFNSLQLLFYFPSAFVFISFHHFFLLPFSIFCFVLTLFVTLHHFLSFCITVFFHRYCRFTGLQRKGGDHLLLLSTTSACSCTFRHLLATLHVRWLPRVLIFIGCNYHTATLWDLPPYWITIWLIDDGE